jgi:N-formylglutamate amidohydrolase
MPVTKSVENVVERIDPDITAIPLVLDSPHSGCIYPEDFGSRLPRIALRHTEDAFIDDLFGAGPEFGATMVRALFPRSYIDPNRSDDDLDPSMIDGEWPGALNPGPKVALGIGLIPCKEPGGDVYDRKLPVAEIRNRIENYWRPYHRMVSDLIDERHATFGRVWHVNCHSMPAVSSHISPEGPGQRRPDMVIGDRDGSTCNPEFTSLIAETLRGFGFDVRVNDPYKGVELVRRYSDPAKGRNSVQIEINRGLYMDEKAVERSADFDSLKEKISELIKVLAGFAVRED